MMAKVNCITEFSDVEEFSFGWKIKNFNRLLKIKKKIESPPFTIPGTEGACCLTCIEYAAPFSHIMIDGVPEAVQMERLFSIALVGPQALCLAGNVHVMFGDKAIRGSFGNKEKDKFISPEWDFVHSQPIQYGRVGGVFQNYGNVFYPVVVNEDEDKPTEINLSLFIPGRLSQSLSTDPPPLGAKVAISELAQSMKTLLLDANLSDVVLKCQEEEIRCHKNILGARSPVFYRMFDVNMEEKKSGVVEIEDIDLPVLQAMLNFIYTGEDVTEDVDDLANLVYAGDKYELKGLLDFCYQKFLHTEDDSKLVEMLIMADRHNLENIKEEAMARITEDKNKFLKDSKFIKLMEKHPKLLMGFHEIWSAP